MKSMLALMAVLFVLVAPLIVTSADAKVLRNKYNAQAVWIFKDADALRRFNKLKASAVYDQSVMIAPLLACEVPQGSKIEILGSGYRTAFVRVVEGSANGCEGTVPRARVQDN